MAAKLPVLVLVLAAWSALGTQTARVVLTVSRQADGVHTTVKNNSGDTLTAFALRVGGAEPVRYHDMVYINRPTVPPGGESQIVFAGPATPEGDVSLEAAIFSNGETEGAAGAIEHLVNERRFLLRALNIVLDHLPAAEQTTAAYDALRKDEAQSAGGDRDVERTITYVNVVIGRLLRDPHAANVQDSLTKLRDALSASKPSLR